MYVIQFCQARIWNFVWKKTACPKKTNTFLTILHTPTYYLPLTVAKCLYLLENIIWMKKNIIKEMLWVSQRVLLHISFSLLFKYMLFIVVSCVPITHLKFCQKNAWQEYTNTFFNVLNPPFEGTSLSLFYVMLFINKHISYFISKQ